MAKLQAGQDQSNGKLDNVLKGLDAGSNAVNLALLPIINNKLGDQIPNGGISGFLGKFKQAFDKFAEWSHLDRILNILTYVNTLHNAYMLSNGLSQTLFSMIGNVLTVIGLKDADGSPIDVGKVVGNTIEGFAKSILGVATVDGIKAEWKKYSRIYQAAANLLSLMQSIQQSILSALEAIGSMVGRIGNALRRFGAIGEKAFDWMNQTPNYSNPILVNLEKAETFVSSLDQIASEAVSVQDSVQQFTKQKEDLDKALKQDDGTKQGKESPEAAQVKATETALKTTSQPPIIPPEAERKPE